MLSTDLIYLIKFMSKLQKKNGDRVLVKVITDKLETTEPKIFRYLQTIMHYAKTQLATPGREIPKVGISSNRINP